jgi:two-component system sensor histidine kinase CiaH
MSLASRLHDAVDGLRRRMGDATAQPGRPEQVPGRARTGEPPGSGSAGPGANAAGWHRDPDAGPTADSRLLRRVRWRLVAWSGGITLAILLALGAALYTAVASSLDSSSLDQLRDQAATLERFLSRVPFIPDRIPAGAGFGGSASSTVALVVTPDGRVLGSDSRWQGLPDAASIDAARASGADLRTMRVGGIPLRVLSQALPGGDGTFVVQIAQDLTQQQRTLEALLSVLVVGGLGALALSVVAGSVYAERALIPIRESLRRQREFAADASHELRTPLAVIRASVSDLRRHREQPVRQVGSALDDIDAEVNELTALVDDLLLLARADSGAVEVARVPLDLGDVAVDAGPALTQLAASRAVRVEFDPAPAPLSGDPVRLAQLIRILGDNAIRHSPPNGTVSIRVRPDGRGARLDVLDEGPGIRPDDLPRLFDRFWRAPDAPEGGTGLGLAIAAWIADRHDATITASNRPEGGAAFEVRFRGGQHAGATA